MHHCPKISTLAPCATLALTLLCATPGLGSPDAPREADDFFAVEELAPGVFLFQPKGPGPQRANSLVVERAGGEVVVIDAQPTIAAARLLLERIPRHAKGPVRFLVLSHAHAEAAGGAAAFPDDAVVITTLEYRDALADTTLDFGAEARLFAGEAWVEPERRRPDMTLSGPVDLDDERQPMRLLPLAPAHATGEMLIELPRADLLYAGGVVFPDGNPYASGPTVGTWISVLTHLVDSGPTRVVGVRGPPVRNDDLRRQRDALAWIQGHVEQGFVDRLPLEAIVQRVLATPGIEQRFATQLEPSFLPRLVHQVVEEAAEHRRKRGRPIPGESSGSAASTPG